MKQSEEWKDFFYVILMINFINKWNFMKLWKS